MTDAAANVPPARGNSESATSAGDGVSASDLNTWLVNYSEVVDYGGSWDAETNRVGGQDASSKVKANKGNESDGPQLVIPLPVMDYSFPHPPSHPPRTETNNGLGKDIEPKYTIESPGCASPEARINPEPVMDHPDAVTDGTPPEDGPYRPLSYSQLRPEQTPADWLWRGYLRPGAVTLLTGLWKAGKTTLLSVLLSRLKAGGELAGLAVRAGRAVVVSEEPAELWWQRGRGLSLDGHVQWLCRPFR
ncbi:MAG: AAA family ATPase, partial [Gemmataceae bacterium]